MSVAGEEDPGAALDTSGLRAPGPERPILAPGR